MKQKKRKILQVGVAWFAAIITIVALVAGNIYANRYSNLISVYLNMSNQKVISSEDEVTEHFSSDYDDDQERENYLRSVSTQIEAEGAVLLENDGTLPLKTGSHISVFGQDSVDPVYGGSGAGSVDTSKAKDLYTGLKEAGFATNETLQNFYTEGDGAKYRKTVPDAMGNGEFAVNEAPVSNFTDEVKNSLTEYQDAAIVVIGRSGGESSDIQSTPLENGSYYLQIDEQEREVLNYACQNFEKVVVLLNTQNPMELGVLKSMGINAVLWIGGLGENGASAVGELLNGEVSPSGRLTDTYAYDSQSAPAMQNLGAYHIVNSQESFGNTYMVYSEGIYVGYRYYETRYEDVVLGNEKAENYNYTEKVQYPFGYGLSYSEFTYSDFILEEAEEQYLAKLTVKNTGDVEAKHTVEVYMQSPYTEYDRQNQIEKSAVELAGYTKTGMLKPGASETVTVEIPKEIMKTYDAKGYSTYIMEAGDYYFAVGTDVHNALNNILAKKGYTTTNQMDAEGNMELAAQVTIESLDSTTYAVSKETESAIGNQFKDADIARYDENFRYLSRSDWEGTWPSTYAGGNFTAPETFVEALKIPVVEDTVEEKAVTETYDEEFGKLTTAMLMETEYDDPLWDSLISQMSAEELDKLVRVGGYATMGIDSTQLPSTQDKDGPAGISSTLVGGENGTSYPPEIVLGSTWNDKLAEEFGKCIGEDSLELEVTGWYAPAMNIHRTPYSGRNFEYFSEDNYLSGKMGASVVKGAQSKGVLVYMKHFALNDQETNRMGVSIMANEQSIRELYLEPFEITVREGNAHGVMVGMNRVGTKWAGAHYGLMTEILRNEWGFEGVAITDQASFEVFAYEDLRAGLAAGTDLWLNTDSELWVLSDEDMNNTVITSMQRAAKNITFAISRSNTMNGLSSSSQIVKIIPLWQKGLYVLDVVFAGTAIFAAVLATWNLKNDTEKRRKLSSILSGICGVLVFGAGMAVCILAGDDYIKQGLALGITGAIACVLNIVVNGKRTMRKEKVQGEQ